MGKSQEKESKAQIYASVCMSIEDALIDYKFDAPNNIYWRYNNNYYVLLCETIEDAVEGILDAVGAISFIKDKGIEKMTSFKWLDKNPLGSEDEGYFFELIGRNNNVLSMECISTQYKLVKIPKGVIPKRIKSNST